MSPSRSPYRFALPRKLAVVIAATLSSLVGVVLVSAAAHVGFFRAAPVARATEVAAVTTPTPPPPNKVVTVYEDVLVPKVVDSEPVASASQAGPPTSNEQEVARQPEPERTVSPSPEPTEAERESDTPNGTDD